MTRHQIDQLSALLIIGIATPQLIATAAAIFNGYLAAAILAPAILAEIGWCCFEGAIVLRNQENPYADQELGRQSNLPFALLILGLTVVGSALGFMWGVL